MPRKHRNRRTMKGGFWDTLTGWGSSISTGASSLWDKTKKATSSATASLTGSPKPYTTTYAQPMQTYTYGGRRTRRRRMRGGFRDNMPTTGLAVHAAPFSGSTAKPHNWVGGRTRRRGRKSHRRR